MSEELPQYLIDANEMITTLEIHPQTTIIRRGRFEMTEEVIPAFIKVYTDFKRELADIDGNSMKVWMFLALSVNRNSEQAHPGIRTIAESCGIGQNTVLSAIKELEKKGLMTVNREDRKYNIYQFPNYVSANTRTASTDEAVGKTASEKPQTASPKQQTASEKRQTASDSGGLTREPDEPDKPEKPHAHNFSSFETAQLKSEYMESNTATFRKAHVMLMNVSSLPAIPRDQEGYIDTVQAMVTRYGEQDTKAALERACLKWISTQGKNGRNYSKTNFKWVDWAMDSLSGGGKPTDPATATYNSAIAFIRGEA